MATMNLAPGSHSLAIAEILKVFLKNRKIANPLSFGARGFKSPPRRFIFLLIIGLKKENY